MRVCATGPATLATIPRHDACTRRIRDRRRDRARAGLTLVLPHNAVRAGCAASASESEVYLPLRKPCRDCARAGARRLCLSELGARGRQQQRPRRGRSSRRQQNEPSGEAVHANKSPVPVTTPKPGAKSTATRKGKRSAKVVRLRARRAQRCRQLGGAATQTHNN
jgi:hypothetical protein